MKKLCCIFNIPSLYREAIYLAMDKEFDCEWYFEKEETDIILFDTKKLKSAHFLKHKKFISRFYRMKGLTGKVWKRKDFDAFLMIGTPMCLSLWVLCILIKIFRPSKKIYFWTHGWYGKETWSEAIIKKIFLKIADELLIYGNYAKRLLIKQGFIIDKIHVIHNSLSYDVQLNLRKQLTVSNIYANHFGNHNPVIIFIGRLSPAKRLDMLIEAVNILKNKGEEYNLVLIGDGSIKEILINQIRSLGIESQCWIYGACYDESTNAELIYNADLCVSPGNIGLTAIHSLMFGTPVITHDNSEYQGPEFEAICLGKTGDFYKHNDREDLEYKISRWLITNQQNRNDVRLACFKEIDEQWNPKFQMKVIKSVLLQ